MHIAATAILTIAILGAAIVPGWCQAQPASRTAPLGSSTGATAAAICSGWCKWYERRKEPIPGVPTLGLDRLSGASNSVSPGKAALGVNNARPPVAAAATVKPAVGNAAVVRPPLKTGPDTNFSYGAGSGGGKKDVFKQPR